MNRTQSPIAGRWRIVLSGTMLQLCLGSVYAWSYFQKPLVDAYGWSNAQAAGSFSLAICCLGLAAAWGGVQLPRLGPRRLAVAGGILFGVGHLVAALALQWKNLPLLCLGYGVLGGCGLGLGYVTPVATAAKWFPDKKGLATGTVIMGFGFGALLMSKVFAPFLFWASGGDLVIVFGSLGIVFLVSVVGLGTLLCNPPSVSPPGELAVASGADKPAFSGVCSRQFAMMWLMFFSNIVAGISLISFQSPLLQNLLSGRNPSLSQEVLAAAGATLIAVSSLFNGLGRLLWGAVSDRLGRARTFQVMLASQVAAFATLTQTDEPWLFGGLICYVVLCYGGGFGAMPSFVLDAFGAARMPAVYGAILTAWSAAGIVGPQWIAYLNDHHAASAARYAFFGNIGALCVGLALASMLRDSPPHASMAPAARSS